MSRAAASQLPAVGSRGRLRRSVDRFPHFVAQAGAKRLEKEHEVLERLRGGQ